MSSHRYLRCDRCAELALMSEMSACESCSALFCPNCAAPFTSASNYAFCFVCVREGDDGGEEDWARWAVQTGEDEEPDWV